MSLQDFCFQLILVLFKIIPLVKPKSLKMFKQVNGNIIRILNDSSYPSQSYSIGGPNIHFGGEFKPHIASQEIWKFVIDGSTVQF